MLRAPSCCGPIQKGQCQDCGHSGAKQRQWVGAGRATVDGNGPVTLWCWAGAPKSLKDIHELLSPQFWVVVISKKNSTYHCSNWFLCRFARPTLLDLTFWSVWLPKRWKRWPKCGSGFLLQNSHPNSWHYCTPLVCVRNQSAKTQTVSGLKFPFVI